MQLASRHRESLQGGNDDLHSAVRRAPMLSEGVSRVRSRIARDGQDPHMRRQQERRGVRKSARRCYQRDGDRIGLVLRRSRHDGHRHERPAPSARYVQWRR